MHFYLDFLCFAGPAVEDASGVGKQCDELYYLDFG